MNELAFSEIKPTNTHKFSLAVTIQEKFSKTITTTTKTL